MDFLQCEGVDRNYDALDLYNSNDCIRNNYFGEYRAGKSYYLLSDYNNAIEHLHRSEEILFENDKFQKYASSLLHLMALTYEKNNDEKETISRYYELALNYSELESKYWKEIKSDYDRYLHLQENSD